MKIICSLKNLLRVRSITIDLIAITAVAIVAVLPVSGRDAPPRALLKMHDEFVLAFIDSQGFGQTRLPAMSRVLHKKVEGTKWFVAHLDLIGIAKHDPPRVFSNEMSIFHRPGERIPLRRAPNRALTAWERQALRELEAGQRLVVKPEGESLRVAGPINAGNECLGCHRTTAKGKTRAGDMLGAFVYALEPVR